MTISQRNESLRDFVCTAPPVATSFLISDPDGYEAGHFRRVRHDLFAGACEIASYKDVRADDIAETNVIHLDFLQRIIQSPMAICDLSTRNPNVLFELGVRQAFDMPVVIVQQEGTERIFDVSILRAIEYKPSLRYRDVLEKQKEIAEALIATRERKTNSVNSLVSLLSLAPASLKSEGADGSATHTMLRTLIGMVSRITEEQRSHPVALRSSSNDDPPSAFKSTLDLIHSCIMTDKCTEAELQAISGKLKILPRLEPRKHEFLRRFLQQLVDRFPIAQQYFSTDDKASGEIWHIRKF